MKRAIELTPTSLQTELWNTLQSVRAKKINAKEANAIATQAREIVRITRAQLEFMRVTNGKRPIKSTFLEQK